MATKFGKELRKIRIDHDDNLKGMADKLGVSVSYVSGVEAGNKSIPFEWLAKLMNAYQLNQKEASALHDAYDECVDSVKLDMHAITMEQRRVTSMFFRKIAHLNDAECEAVMKKLVDVGNTD